MSEQTALTKRPGEETGAAFNGNKTDVSQAAGQAEHLRESENPRPLLGVTLRVSGP